MSTPAIGSLLSRGDEARLPTLVRLFGAVGAVLGVVVGVVDVLAGPSMRSWVGDKQDTTPLGVATIVLSFVALASAAMAGMPRVPWLRRRPAAGEDPTPSTGRRLAVAAGLLVPAVICFTTAGRLWYVPGVMLLVAGLGAVAWAREAGHVLATLEREWLGVLATVLAVCYVLLGSVAPGMVGVLGIAGGVLVVIALTGIRPRRVAMALLVIGTAPFAIATWWSVVTPLVGLLIVLLGGLAVRSSARRQ